jgi:hypothetical protein
VAGIWAYFHFRVTEVPAGARNFHTSIQVTWEKADTSSCYAILNASVENLSRGAFKITEVGWKVWIVKEPPLIGDLTFENPDTWTAAVPNVSSKYSDGPFVQAYPPGAKTEYDLTWRVRRQPSFALFKVELFPKGSEREPSDSFYAWDKICNGV